MAEYKCPACGAALKWNSDEQKMKCDYCDNTYDIATLEEFNRGETYVSLMRANVDALRKGLA